MQELKIGSALIEPYAPRDKNDCIFLNPDGISGFTGSTADTGEHTDRPYGDGAWSVDGFLSAGSMMLDGGIIAPSPFDLIKKINRFMSEFTNREIKISAKDEAGNYTRIARRIALPKVTRHGNDRCFARFNVQMWFPDPHYYGETRSAPAGVRMVNYGSADAIPTVQVRGPQASGYTVGDGEGGEVVVTSALSAGGTDVIDLRTGWVRRGGVIISGAVSKFQPWVVPAFGSKVHTFTGSPSLVSFEVTDTYM